MRCNIRTIKKLDNFELSHGYGKIIYKFVLGVFSSDFNGRLSSLFNPSNVQNQSISIKLTH